VSTRRNRLSLCSKHLTIRLFAVAILELSLHGRISDMVVSWATENRDKPIRPTQEMRLLDGDLCTVSLISTFLFFAGFQS